MLQSASHTVLMYGSAKRHAETQQQAGGNPSSRILCHNGVRKKESIFSHGELFFCAPLDELPGREAWCTHCPLTMHVSALSPLAHVDFICFDLWPMCWCYMCSRCLCKCWMFDYGRWEDPIGCSVLLMREPGNGSYANLKIKSSFLCRFLLVLSAMKHWKNKTKKKK